MFYQKFFPVLMVLCILVSSVTACGESTPTPTNRPTPFPSPAPLRVTIDNDIDLEHFAATASFILHFDQPVDLQSGYPPLEIIPQVAGTMSWNAPRTQLTFTPVAGFTPGQSYLVRLNQNLKSRAGAGLDRRQEWRIDVPSAPQIMAHDPNTPVLSQRRPTIHLRFDRKMDQESVAAALVVSPTVPLDLQWKDEMLTIEPLEPLAPGNEYSFTLRRTATDSHNAPLEQDYTWSYRLHPLISRTTWPIRSKGASAPLIISFNYRMDVESVENALTFEPTLEGDVGWDDTQTTITFTPTVPPLNETKYTVRFTGSLRDAEGDELPPTEPLCFTTPPPILNTTPRPNQTVDPTTAIRVVFDRPMDSAATEYAFHITPAVSGSFEWRETTLTFRPDDGYLEESTRYTVTIDTSAKGADGNPILNKPYTWSFRTNVLRDLANFGIGPNAQVTDADGRRAVQFQFFHKGPATLVFELYRLNTTQFLDRYASGFKGVAGWEEDPTISTEDTTLVKRWQTDVEGGDWYTIHETIIPDDVPPGLYVLNLKAGHINAQLILVLTRRVITVKQAEGQIVAWVTDINGGSVPGAEVSVYSRDGQLICQGHTDHKGVFRTEVDRDPQPLIVIARDGEDITATGLSNEWLSSDSQWNYWWVPAPVVLDWAVYIYTDRPIYRPGQTVFFKGIVRSDNDAELDTPPIGTPVTVRIRDARNNVVQTLRLTTNHFGTVDGEFQVAAGAMLGDYAVEMVVSGEVHRQVFKVQDYRKPDYKVSVTTDAADYVAGQSIVVRVDTRYFFGEPVSNAQLTIKQYELGKQSYWDGSGDDEYIWYDSGHRVITGITDGNGYFTFTLNAKLGTHAQDWYWRSSVRRSTWGIEVTADDGSRQTVSSFAVVEVFGAAEVIGLDTGGYFKTPGIPFTVRANATTIADKPIAGHSLTLQLRRYNAADRDYTTVLQTINLTTDAHGQATTSLTVREPGYYQLYLSGTDHLGHKVNYTSWVYVFSDARTWVRHSSGLGIVADQESYQPGDTARLAIESDWSGPALLTFERGTTRREMAIELTAPLTLVEVPIQPDDAPNIFITVNAWREQDTTGDPAGRRLNRPESILHTASTNLRVSTADKTLRVTITPDKETYAPREKATFTVHVTDSSGEPASAEVSLALVDEAIFSLSDELCGPIHNAFYYERAHVVRTYDGLALYRYVPCECGGGGGGGEDGGFSAANPRSDFPDTAAWFPVLHTDASGKAVVTLTLPDNLTSWRVTAKAATADTKVGETYVNVVTHQEIVVRPILPRGLTAGDHVQLSAFVHNYGSRARSLHVSIAIDSLEIETPITQTITLSPGERRLVSWWATAVEAGDAQVTIWAETDGAGGAASDAVRITMPVRPLAVPDVHTYVGAFEGELTQDIFLPEDALEMSTVKIELSRSIAGSLLQGVEYLTGYPFGCVEQTMSKALPNAVVGRAFHQLGVGDPTIQADLPPKINASVQRLYGFQHNDGGWGWWFDDATHPYQTAWVVFGLSMTAEAGYEVDPGVIERGVDWLGANLYSMDIRTRAYALYSMAIAGHGDLEATRAMLDHLDELDTFSQAALALALHELGATEEAQEVLGLLAETATAEDGQVFWLSATGDGHYYNKTMSSSTRSTALALSAFVRISPGHELEPGIVRWLMSQRQRYGWGTTNETAYAIIALTDHLLSREAASATTTYSVTLNDRPIASGTLGRGEPAVSLEIPAEQMERGTNRLHLQQSGGGHLYYVISNQVYLPRAEIEAAGKIQVSRVYLDAKTGRPITMTQPGQLVKIQLRVTVPKDSFYIIVEDNLPGGLEALNEGLNTTSHDGSAYDRPRTYWREYGYNHKEVYGDRVSFFITELPKGTRTFTYLARATHEGEFVALPAEVYAMYDLSTWGRSASDAFTLRR